MRLLTKNEVAVAQNKDKAREISEGLKISRRVDSLRELEAQEELKLNKYREETLAEIAKQIREETKKRDSIAEESRILQKKLDKMLPGLATKREELNTFQSELEQRKQSLDEREEKLGFAEIDIAVSLKDADDALKRALTHEESAKFLHGKSQQDRDEARQLFEKAENTEKRALDFQSDTEMALSVRESALSRKEKEIEEKEKVLLERERELVVEKAQVADQRKTLERSIERLRKNRLA